MNPSEPQPAAPKPKRCWYQYSLRSLLLFVLVCSIPCSWLAVRMKRARKQRASLVAVEKLHGMAWYDYESNGFGAPEYERPLSEPQFLLRWFGTDFFHPVVGVTFSTGALYDIAPKTRISEEDLSCLDGLVNLKMLDLRQQPIGDNTLACLRKLSELERLDIGGTRVTDVGLEYLKGLNQLQGLDLDGTQVTDQGVKRFQQALPSCKIKWQPPTKDDRQNRATPDQPDG